MPRQIAAIEIGKHDREDPDDDYLEDGYDAAKRPRMEVAAVDTRIPLYEDGYESEDRFESESRKLSE
jgi:hypothetical protein